MTAGLAIYDTVGTSIAASWGKHILTFCRCRSDLTAVMVMAILNVTLYFSTFHHRYTRIVWAKRHLWGPFSSLPVRSLSNQL